MMIHEPTLETIGDRTRVSWPVELESTGGVFTRTGNASEVLWIDWPADYFRPDHINGDAALLICFPIAMRLGERMNVAGSVSGALIWNVLEAMAIYESYYPGEAKAVPLEAEAGAALAGVETGRIGSFHSGGVDSFFNIAELKRLHEVYGTPEITDLWLIRGMDIALSDDAMWEKVKTLLSSHDHLPETMRLADLQTNARDLHAGIVGWEQMGFSPILGGVAKCFAPMVGEALIGSYGPYDEIAPHASSPLVDPMWSCDNQRVRHFSCRADRAEKVRTICDVMPEALKVLRVCWQNPNGDYNCGRCEKCLRTQMQLEIIGALEQCPTFETPLTPETLGHLVIPWKNKSFYTRDFWRELSKQAAAAGMEDYARVIDQKLANARRHAMKGLGRRAAMTLPASVGRRLKAVFGQGDAGGIFAAPCVMPERMRNRSIRNPPARNPRRSHTKTGWLDLFSPEPVVPWTKAYRSRRKTLISETLQEEDLMVRFRNRESLPSGYGIGIDERCVEYPWLIARLSDEPERYLDAGSTHDHPMILETGFFDQKEMHIVTLHPEPKCYWQRGISYLFADIRDLPIKDGFYGTISSISTLEHVGMDNRAYTGGKEMGAPDSRGFVRALRELDRVLEPGGDLHVTVPFGRFADLSTSLVFDADLLRELIRATALELVEETYYRYRSSGWQIATSADCADAEFVQWAVQPFSSRSSVFPLQQDGAVAARAVACLHFRKDQKTASGEE